MLNWLKNKVSQENPPHHPFATAEGVRHFLSEMPKGRPETLLGEISDILGNPKAHLDGLTPDLVAAPILQIDDHYRPAVDLCWRGLLIEAQLGASSEQKLKALDTYFQSVMVATRFAMDLMLPAILSAAPAQGAPPSQLPPQVGALGQRAMYGQIERLLIQRMRYRAPPPAWWSDSLALLQATRSAGVINLKQASRPNDPTTSSTWLEYLVALMAECAPLGNLSHHQLDALYRISRWLEPQFLVQERFNPQTPFVSSLHRPLAPVRLKPGMNHEEGMIYFGPGLAHQHLAKLRNLLISSERLPGWLLQSNCPFDKIIHLLETLEQHWSPTPPQRRHGREQRKEPLHVVTGFSTMRRMVALSAFARSGRRLNYTSHFELQKFSRFGFADPTEVPKTTGNPISENAPPLEIIRSMETSGDKELMDAWELQDVSPNGLGAIAPFLKPWITAGALIGYRMDSESDWRIGILRRIGRTERGNPSIGIESYPELPMAARFEIASSPSDPWSLPGNRSTQTVDQDAIVLSMEKDLLLLPANSFLQGRRLQLEIGQAKSLIQLARKVASGPDFDLVEFQVAEALEP